MCLIDHWKNLKEFSYRESVINRANTNDPSADQMLIITEKLPDHCLITGITEKGISQAGT